MRSEPESESSELELLSLSEAVDIMKTVQRLIEEDVQSESELSSSLLKPTLKLIQLRYGVREELTKNSSRPPFSAPSIV